MKKITLFFYLQLLFVTNHIVCNNPSSWPNFDEKAQEYQRELIELEQQQKVLENDPDLPTGLIENFTQYKSTIFQLEQSYRKAATEQERPNMLKNIDNILQLHAAAYNSLRQLNQMLGKQVNK